MMNTRYATIAHALVVCCSAYAADGVSTNRVSQNEEKAAVASIVEELRRTGVLEDMKKYGLVTNSEPNITWQELSPAMWKFKAEHSPLGIKPAAWEQIPPPDLRGTNDPGAVHAFVRTHGWNMHTGFVALGWGFVETQPIKGLPWKEIEHREFQAVTANGILYVILDGFAHNCLGVAYNPKTNRFDSAMVGFKPIGDHWYAWRQPEDPMTLTQQYEGGAQPTDQPDGAANRSQPPRSETNRAPVAAGSGR
jgi:hypothetical protein